MPRTERKPTYRLEWIALALALALVVARGTMQEFLREPFEVLPGSEPVPRSAGPAASVGLDLLCCIPALLVLVRRVGDKRFSLRHPRSFVPLALLCIWMLASTFWAADKFGALVTACHWTAAMTVMWAAAQLVRDWLRLRLVAAVTFGLLPVYVIYGVNYRFLELPEVQKTFRENKERMLKEHGLQEGTFAAKQLVDKVNLGEMFGFLTSPNSFGALLSLLLVLGAGLLIQRIRDERDAPLPIQAGAKRQRSPGSVVAPKAAISAAIVTIVLVMLLGLWIMRYTRSRTAFVTPVLAAILLLLIWRFHDAMARRAKVFYFLGLAVFAVIAAAVIALGVTRGSLLHSSLTFRWQYWVGSLGVFRERPITGVGWNNFAYYYLAHRLPAAPEEIKDPHDFIVRFFTELGLVGGILLIAWQLRVWWELTRPVWPAGGGDNSAPGVIKFVAAVAAGGILLSTLLAVDFTLGAPELDVMRRLLWLGAMIITSSLATLRSLHSQEPDARPAPWVLYAILVGVGVFLVHNLIDFSLFETGPMFLFALLTGSALGLRLGDASVEPRSSKALAIALAVGVVVWVAAGLLLWGPLLTAQRKADAADDAIRANRVAQAAPLLVEANADAWRLNGDCAFGAARISPPEKAVRLLDEAIRENPRELSYYVSRARAEMQQAAPDRRRVRSDFESALVIDPNNVPLRLDYAKTLAGFGDRALAQEQYKTALSYNAKLNPDEKKRLTPQQLDEVREAIQKLER
jgi:O-antigen ligase